MPPTTFMEKIFARSPLGPLQEHMRECHHCATQLTNFFNATQQNDWDKASTIQQAISAAEKRADELKKNIRLNLPKGLFLPVARSDLLELLARQDAVANRSKDIAGCVLGRQLLIPPTVFPLFMQLLKQAIAASAQASRAINELDGLLEVGFRGKETQLVKTMVIELDQLEHHSDKLERELRHKLYDIETDYPPLNMMFVYQIIDWVGDVADRAEKVGDQLQVLIAH